MSLVYIVKKDNSFDIQKAKSLVEQICGFELTDEKILCENNHKAALYKTNHEDAHERVKKAVEDNSFDFDVWANTSFPTLKKNGQICLDMDMTSVQIEGIDEIARRLGVFDKVAEITSQAMHGGLDFATSLTKRVSMLKDGDATVIEDVKTIMKETDGLDFLMKTASDNGFYKAICSGGFEQLICVLEKKYNLDAVYANSLEIVDGKLTGKVDKRIVDAQVKKEGVLELAQKHGIEKEQIIVLGDGANDLKMIEIAGLGIAYHAKPLVKQSAPFAISYSDLSAVALLLKLNS